MRIILVRHGAYTPADSDPDEGLSENGKEEVAALKAKLTAQSIHPTKIFASPKKRAQQTASILASGKDIETTDLLKGGENPQGIVDHIIGLDGTIMLVGHNPFMERLATILGQSHLFHTAGCAILENGRLLASY